MITVRNLTPGRRSLAATACALAVGGSLLSAQSAALAVAPPGLAAVPASSTSSPALLRQGSTGTAVREWQSW